MGQPFETAGMRLNGKPIPIAESIEYYDPRNIGYFSVAQNVMLYRQSSIQSRELMWFDATGKELEHWGEPVRTPGDSDARQSHGSVVPRQPRRARKQSVAGRHRAKDDHTAYSRCSDGREGLSRLMGRVYLPLSPPVSEPAGAPLSGLIRQGGKTGGAGKLFVRTEPVKGREVRNFLDPGSQDWL